MVSGVGSEGVKLSVSNYRSFWVKATGYPFGGCDCLKLSVKEERHRRCREARYPSWEKWIEPANIKSLRGIPVWIQVIPLVGLINWDKSCGCQLPRSFWIKAEKVGSYQDPIG